MGWYFAFFLVSGYCSLVYEIVWLRLAMGGVRRHDSVHRDCALGIHGWPRARQLERRRTHASDGIPDGGTSAAALRRRRDRHRYLGRRGPVRFRVGPHLHGSDRERRGLGLCELLPGVGGRQFDWILAGEKPISALIALAPGIPVVQDDRPFNEYYFLRRRVVR
jgi:hypothetical protein